jgi:hypothetical protein
MQCDGLQWQFNSLTDYFQQWKINVNTPKRHFGSLNHINVELKDKMTEEFKMAIRHVHNSGNFDPNQLKL